MLLIFLTNFIEIDLFFVKVHAVGGPGCIVRVLSDGRRV